MSTVVSSLADCDKPTLSPTPSGIKIAFVKHQCNIVVDVHMNSGIFAVAISGERQSWQ